MEPLFRLMLVRPATDQDPRSPSIPLAQESPFQQSLEQASGTQRPREALQRVARAFVGGSDFLGDPDATPRAASLAALATTLKNVERQSILSHDDVVAAVTGSFGTSPDVLAQDGELQTARTRLRDSLVAIKLLQEEHHRPIERLTNQLRDLELIVTTAADNSFPSSAQHLRMYRRRSLLLPTVAGLRSILSTSELEESRRKQAVENDLERRKRIDAQLSTYRRLEAAVAELTRLGPDHFQTTPQERHEGVVPPEEFGRTAIMKRRATYLERLSDLNLKQLQASLDRSEPADPLRLQDMSDMSSVAALVEKVLSGELHPMAGSAPFRPLPPQETGFRLRAEAAEALTVQTRDVLRERKLGLTDQPLDRIVDSLQEERRTIGREVEAALARPAQQTIRRLGDTLLTITTPAVSAWRGVALGTSGGSSANLVPASVPSTRGNVAPAGIADLLIVKQQLIRYETADVAHIENVLKSERKQREHTLRRETEEITFHETESTTTEERELESTNRFEMTRETSATIREDASLKTGLTLSGSYGPTVNFSVSAEGSLSRSKEEATKAASTFSQDVTERSVHKATERVLDRITRRVTTEVIDRNTHELNNVAGAGHVRGVYQWVSKVYQAQMFNYGLRTMFDFMVPEPAAFIVEVLKASHAHAMDLRKPPEFTLLPNEVTEATYETWVRDYGATDVVPPPEMYKTKSLDFKAGGGEDGTNYNHSAQILIDEGYRATFGSVGKVLNAGGQEYTVDVILGTRTHRFVRGKPWVWTTTLDSERDSVPFVVDTCNVDQIAIAVEVKCERTERALTKWSADTHAKLMTAYKARLEEYESKLAALQAQAGVAIQGKNPALNMDIMKDELKKNCVSILTDQHYDLFDAMETAWSNGLPQIDLPEARAEGPYVRFFEQALEWENMTWVTYPYYWGRKDEWGARIAVEDPDPLFTEFLKAGYCRVSVPARPGFEGAIDHFMTYGELWNGGPLPPISSALYVPIADEIAERLGRPGTEVPQGEPWLVRVPTSLVYLRADDSLPRWQQDAAGNWVEA